MPCALVPGLRFKPTALCDRLLAGTSTCTPYPCWALTANAPLPVLPVLPAHSPAPAAPELLPFPHQGAAPQNCRDPGTLYIITRGLAKVWLARGVPVSGQDARWRSGAATKGPMCICACAQALPSRARLTRAAVCGSPHAHRHRRYGLSQSLTPNPWPVRPACALRVGQAVLARSDGLLVRRCMGWGRPCGLPETKGVHCMCVGD